MAAEETCTALKAWYVFYQLMCVCSVRWKLNPWFWCCLQHVLLSELQEEKQKYFKTVTILFIIFTFYEKKVQIISKFSFYNSFFVIGEKYYCSRFAGVFFCRFFFLFDFRLIFIVWVCPNPIQPEKKSIVDNSEIHVLYLFLLLFNYFSSSYHYRN